MSLKAPSRILCNGRLTNAITTAKPETGVISPVLKRNEPTEVSAVKSQDVA